MRDLGTFQECCNFRNMHFNMVFAKCTVRHGIFAWDEHSLLILMVRDLLFTVVPSKIEVAFSFMI